MCIRYSPGYTIVLEEGAARVKLLCMPHSMGTSACIICRLVMYDFIVLPGQTVMSLVIRKGVLARRSMFRLSTVRRSGARCFPARDKVCFHWLRLRESRSWTAMSAG